MVEMEYLFLCFVDLYLFVPWFPWLTRRVARRGGRGRFDLSAAELYGHGQRTRAVGLCNRFIPLGDHLSVGGPVKQADTIGLQQI